MIRCKKCEKLTERGEPTAKFFIYTYIENTDKESSKRNIKTTIGEMNVCSSCRGYCIK